MEQGSTGRGQFEEQLPSLINSSDLSLDNSISTNSTAM